MDIKNLTNEEKDLLIQELYPIHKIINETILSAEDLRNVAEFCMVTGYWGKDLRELLQCINPNIVTFNDAWFIPRDMLIYNLEKEIQKRKMGYVTMMVVTDN